MKKLKKIILVMLMMYCFSIKSFASTGVITTEATRIRKESNTSSEILTVIYKNDNVEVLETNGDWLKIKYGEYTGFVKKEFVSVKDSADVSNTQTTLASNSNSASTTTANTTNSKNYTLSENKSIRLFPNFSSKVVGTIKKGSDISVVLELGNWKKISSGELEGWILNDIEIQNNSQDSTQKSSTNVNNVSTSSNNVVSEKKVSTANTVKSENKVSNTVKNETVSTGSTTTSETKIGKINVETAKFRKGPSTDSGMISFLDEGDKVTIIGEEGDWYKITYSSTTGYVSKSLVTIVDGKTISSRSLAEERTINTTSEEKAESTSCTENNEKVEESTAKAEDTEVKSNTTGQEVVDYAKTFLGCKYVLGGKNPATGVDCSGFTKYVFAKFGYTLSGVSYEQVNSGVEVSRENLTVGDLILFLNEGKTKIGHVGIYIGNDEFIHAANPKRGVVTDNLKTLSYYNERYVTARRIVQ